MTVESRLTSANLVGSIVFEYHVDSGENLFLQGGNQCVQFATRTRELEGLSDDLTRIVRHAGLVGILGNIDTHREHQTTSFITLWKAGLSPNISESVASLVMRVLSRNLLIRGSSSSQGNSSLDKPNPQDKIRCPRLNREFNLTQKSTGSKPNLN